MNQARWTAAAQHTDSDGLLMHVACACSRLTSSFSDRLAPPSDAMTGVQVVYAHIFGVVIWHEHETVLGVVGTLLVVAGAFGASVEQKSKKERQVCQQ